MRGESGSGIFKVNMGIERIKKYIGFCNLEEVGFSDCINGFIDIIVSRGKNDFQKDLIENVVKKAKEIKDKREQDVNNN